MSNTAMDKDDICVVSHKRVSCDGGGGALGHPRVWLDMGEDQQVRCKYCDRLFKLDPSADLAGH